MQWKLVKEQGIGDVDKLICVHVSGSLTAFKEGGGT